VDYDAVEGDTLSRGKNASNAKVEAGKNDWRIQLRYRAH